MNSCKKLCKNICIVNPPPKSKAVSEHMRSIGTKRTGVERRARRVVRLEKLKFQGNVKNLPGSPDLIIPSLDLAIFVNGCFWHGCPHCYTPPKHNRKWWNNKIAGNRRRDRRVTRQLRAQGYSVVHLWEHDTDERMRVRIRGAAKHRLKAR